MGSIYYKPEFMLSAFAEYANNNVNFLVIAGDLVEGMSPRPGHIYECTHLGYDAQKTYAIEQLSRWKGKIYAIDGNHDRWYLKANGALIVKDICDALPNATFLGHDEGDIRINGIWIKVFHGEDGASYATSYRIQKIIESISGGEKPNVLLLGHDHKQSNFFERNIHAVGGGCLSTQSRWMRSKRMAAHPGFWILEMTINKSGIVKFTTTWYPFYC
jgi:predicted phosphodiesterase